MFSEDVTFFVYLGYMSLVWGLIFAAALLLARFVKTWLITALVNFHAMRGDMADEARDSISSEVSVGHWGNVMPPVLVNNLVPSHTVPAIQRSQSQPSRLAQVPSAPLPPDPPPLYEEVVESFSQNNNDRKPRKSSTTSSQAEVPPPLYWDLYPAVSSSAGSSLLCVLPGSPDPTGSPSQVLRGRRPSQSLEKLPPAPPSPHTHTDKVGK